MIIDSALYLDGARQQDDESSPSDVERQAREQGGFAWVTLSDPTAQEMQQLQRCFKLPGLAVEDVQEGEQRPKLERYGDENSFLVVKTARYDKSRTAIDFGEVDVFIGARYAVVIGPSAVTPKSGARTRLDARPDVANSGSLAVAWAVLDEVIDAYEPVLDRLGEELEETEEAVLQRGLDQSKQIYVLRREAARFLRALHPMLGPVGMLERGDLPEVPSDLRPLFRDVGDHVRRLYEEIVMLGHVLDGLLNTNLAAVSVRQNVVVQKVSGWAAIAAAPTIIAGIYGMNFRHMPELAWPIGYPSALALMVVVVLGLWRHFKRVGWL